jgi:hypothetical protein
LQSILPVRSILLSGNNRGKLGENKRIDTIVLLSFGLQLDAQASRAE